MKSINYVTWLVVAAVLTFSILANAEEAAASDNATIECEYCKGVGQLVDVSTTKKTGYVCTICNGEGKISRVAENACPYCRGLKRVPMVMPDSGIAGIQEPVTNKRSGVISARLIGQDCPICKGSGRNTKP